MATNKSKRGFAAMDPERRRRIARKGGQSSHKGGFASMSAMRRREIASKGGKASH